MKKTAFLLLIVVAAVSAAPDFPSDTCRQEMWVPNGSVNAIAANDEFVCIGGYFSYVSPYIGSVLCFDAATNAVKGSFPKFDWDFCVNAVCDDGHGGCFIGGKATNTLRGYIVHVLADGSIDPLWDVSASSEIFSISLNNGILYVGGAFTFIGDKSRNYLAALDAATGDVTEWNPGANGYVSYVAATDRYVIAEGQFNSFRAGIAVIDAATGVPAPVELDSIFHPWHWSVLGANPLVLIGETLYSASVFPGDEKYRCCIAAFNTATDKLTVWNMDYDGTAHMSIGIIGTTIYLAGEFSSIGGKSRKNIAAIDMKTGDVLEWSPGRDLKDIYQIVTAANTVYVLDDYDRDGTGRLFAAFDATTGEEIEFTRNSDDISGMAPWKLLKYGNNNIIAYFNGVSQSILGKKVSNLAIIDRATGMATDFNVSINKEVRAIALYGDTAYIAGSFSNVGGMERNGLAAVEITTGKVTDWNPSADSLRNNLSINKGIVYVAGNFLTIAGKERRHLAAFNAATGEITDWAPNPEEPLNAMAFIGDKLYAGVDTLKVFDCITGESSNPFSLDSTIDAIAAYENTLCIAGKFQHVGNIARKYLATINTTTGEVNPFNPSPVNVQYDGTHSPGRIESVAMYKNMVFACGWFDYIANENITFMAALDATTGETLEWTPEPNFQSYNLYVHGRSLFAGVKGYGQNISIGEGISHSTFAQFYLEPDSNTAVRTEHATPGNPLFRLCRHGSSGAHIECDIHNTRTAMIKVFTIAGQLVSAARYNDLQPGVCRFPIDFRSRAKGCYIVNFNAGDIAESRLVTVQ